MSIIKNRNFVKNVVLMMQLGGQAVLIISPKTVSAIGADMPYQCRQGNIDFCLKACVDNRLTEACMMVVSLMQNNSLERLFAERNYQLQQLQEENEQKNGPGSKEDTKSDTENDQNLSHSRTLNAGDCDPASTSHYKNYRKFSALYYLNQHQSIRNYDNIYDFKPCRPSIASKQPEPSFPDKKPKQIGPKNRSKPAYFIKKIKSVPKKKYLGDLNLKPQKPRQNIYLSKKYAYSRMIKRLHQNQ